MMIYLHILVMALVTYLIRMLPMVLIKHEIQSRFIRSFLHYIPYTVLAAMTVPAIFYSTASLWSALVGLVIAVVLALWDRSLLLVSICACAGAFVTELLVTYVF